ncbi:MAG TPA: hypothetical protein VN969_36745 [Streptosporangiaceae bacterium]|nr:hypothetical protein [Streptosporangiaceae bacterium]
MSSLVGIIRREDEIKTALAELEKLRDRAAKVCAPGGTAYNPGWHLALDLRNMLLIAQCVAMDGTKSSVGVARPAVIPCSVRDAGMIHAEPPQLVRTVTQSTSASRP